MYSDSQSWTVAGADAEDRAQFFRRVYFHLALALAAFAGLEYVLLQTETAIDFSKFVLTGGRGVWLAVLAGFTLITWMARGMAAGASRVMQYLGLSIYVAAQAILFVPLVVLAMLVSKANGVNPAVMLTNAGILTAILFLALSFVVLTTRRDFSFLGAFISVGGMVALGLIVCGALFGFDLGLAFSGGMIVLASAAILYDTSKIMHSYPTDHYVAAALELFASVVLLLWYILRLLIRLQRR